MWGRSRVSGGAGARGRTSARRASPRTSDANAERKRTLDASPFAVGFREWRKKRKKATVRFSLLPKPNRETTKILSLAIFQIPSGEFPPRAHSLAFRETPESTWKTRGMSERAERLFSAQARCGASWLPRGARPFGPRRVRRGFARVARAQGFFGTPTYLRCRSSRTCRAAPASP